MDVDNKDECIRGSNLASTNESAFDISGRDTSDSMPWNAIAEWAEGEDRTCAERPCRGIEGYVQLGRLYYHSAQSSSASSRSPLDDFEGAHDQD